MRRLFVPFLALLPWLLMASAMPAYANGKADTDIPVSSSASSGGTMTVSEHIFSDQHHTYQSNWQPPAWTNWVQLNPTNPSPAIMFGNFAFPDLTRSGGYASGWTVTGDGELECYKFAQSWTGMAAGFDNVSRRATPALATRLDGSYRIYAIDTSSQHFVRTATYSGFAVCDIQDLGTFGSTGGGSYYSPGAASSAWNDELLGISGEDYNICSQALINIDPYANCGHFWWQYNGGQWNESPKGCSSAVGMTNGGTGVFDMFCRGWDGQMWHSADGTNFDPLGGAFIAGPSCVEPSPPRIDCFAPGTDQNVYHAARVNGQWTVFGTDPTNWFWQNLGSA